jgi:hypothetical protein
MFRAYLPHMSDDRAGSKCYNFRGFKSNQQIGLRIEMPPNSQRIKMKLSASISALVFLFCSSQAFAVVLYQQDFENPTGFVNDNDDINIFRTVNDLYSGQPAGFEFAQTFTVETLLVTGTQAFGTGYSDPAGTAGNYALGMLSNAQDDRLGLAFDVGSNDFLNVFLDISSIDLSAFGGPFNPNNIAPEFRFTLFDNPGGATGIGGGTVLDSQTASAASSAGDTFVWTQAVLPLAALGNTDGNVILQIDLLTGGYAAMDNLRIEASDIPAAVPVPAAIWLFGTALLGLIGFGKGRKAS